MSRSARFGGVTVQFNDDGTLFVYQPDSSRVMSRELANQLGIFLANELGLELGDVRSEGAYAQDLAENLKDPEFREAYEQETAAIAAEVEARVAADTGERTPLAEVAEEFGVDLAAVELPENPSLKELQDVCAAFGLPTYGTKRQIIERLKKRGITGPGLDGD